MKTLSTLFFCLLVTCCFADYVEVSRNANVYRQANKDSELLFKAQPGDQFELVTSSQTNGYFNIKIPNSGNTGWIYRSLVRRHEGSLAGTPPVATSASGADVIVNVVDIGAGLCTVIQLPNNKYVVYDAGGNKLSNGNASFAQIQEVIPENGIIEMLVLSHTDADHIVAASQIIRNYEVHQVLSTGFERSMITSKNPTKAHDRLTNAITDAGSDLTYINLNQKDSNITPGVTFNFDGAQLIFLCGFGSPPESWGLKSSSEKLNSVSIVMKLEYQGSSVLFCGDAVGRHIGDPENTLIATEKFLVEQAAKYLSSDIVIAAHHGADNGNSEAFIEKVDPQAVIFASGHEHNHPTKTAAERYLKTVDVNNIYRTDRGDDERKEGKTYKEWDYGRIDGCHDKAGDDDIEILLKADGSFRINYLNINPPCAN